ncbi:MAG: hypothetical protein F4X83_11845 [Chloroflexi bacterium]|nr:hypothetical protein [Chloroflexota bacterium]
MWQPHETPLGVHVVRSVVNPAEYRHGKYALRQVLDVDATQVARTAGARRPRSFRRGESTSPKEGAPKNQRTSGEAADSSPPDVRRMVFWDTETTGLGGPGTYVFLVGLGYLEDDAFVVRQHFIRSPDEEPAMLRAVAETLPQWPTMTTFNGVSFDLPLLRARMKAHNVKMDLSDVLHSDLLYGARRLWQRRLPNCRLQTLEEHILDFKRQGDVPSAAVPGMYFDYLESGDLSSLEGVFHHNVLDIVSLAGLMVAMHEHVASAESAD